MFDIIGKRKWFLLISVLLIVPGLMAMIISTAQVGTPVRLSIDFTGGTLLELEFEQMVLPGDVRQVFTDRDMPDTSVQTADEGRNVIIRTKPIDADLRVEIEQELAEKFGPLTELRYESVGPTVGREVTRAGVVSILAVSVVILAFIAFAFRRVPHAFRYGVCAIVKMFHDVLVAFGVFAILGILVGWEVDALFLSAILTVIGFSVQDVIVVFDRIRENIPRRRGEQYEVIVNRSLLETLHRSLATQLNAIFIMVAILLFGGATIKQFIFAILLGMITGTYSSLCVAVPLLVVWEKGEVGQFFRRLRKRPA
ncbi:MAG: protein translocase subunit SecF [Chloroflexota bacterium]|nr:protein translocase subunit SecF [Anaerolineae bacterium]